jgi:hypothetical protein
LNLLGRHSTCLNHIPGLFALVIFEIGSSIFARVDLVHHSTFTSCVVRMTGVHHQA